MLEETSAMIGIDIQTATSGQIAKRLFDFCGEMDDCYDEGELEHSAFQAIQMALLMMNGGVFHAD